MRRWISARPRTDALAGLSFPIVYHESEAGDWVTVSLALRSVSTLADRSRWVPEDDAGQARSRRAEGARQVGRADQRPAGIKGSAGVGHPVSPADWLRVPECPAIGGRAVD